MKKKVDDSDDEDAALSPRRRKQKQKRQAPQWQNKKDIAAFVSSLLQSALKLNPNSMFCVLSDDSDSDDGSAALQGIENTPRNSKRRKQDDKKRQRSRSRSITPPPEVPMHQIQNARSLVRYVTLALRRQ